MQKKTKLETLLREGFNKNKSIFIHIMWISVLRRLFVFHIGEFYNQI